MESRWTWWILALLLMLAPAGCEQTADDDDTAGDDDAADDDAADDDTGDDDTEMYADCPLNSGYPCTCEAGIEACDDGTECIVPEGGEGFGVCAIECDGMAQNHLCEDIGDWGAAGACMFAAGGAIGEGMGENCAVLCLWEGAHGPCPPGQECVETWMPGADICIPTP